jgi:hypothetical protein
VVRLVPAHPVAIDRRTQNRVAKRASAWIVQGIILATTAFALLDLYLLGTSGHS